MARAISDLRAGARRAGAALLASPLPERLLRARALRGGAITLLCYHTLGADEETFDAWTVLRAGDFRAQLDALRARYRILALDDALAEAAGEARPPRGAPPAAVLTFDDGEAGLHRHLLAILEAERVPATVYVATGQIETGRPYWFDRLMTALQGPGPFRVALEGVGAWTVGAGRGPARWAAISDILEALKARPEAEREPLAERAIGQAPPGGKVTPLAPLGRAELAALAACPFVTIGAHSHCHGLLDRMDPAAARASMARSRGLLEDWTGREVRHFAWPNGNHSAALRAAAAALGFRTAAALGERVWHPAGAPDRFALPRIGIGRYDGPARFRLRLLGI
jgi:peptidoglycan/xylan/chitin deacetylase (PgdA/CDA1 family)